MDYGHLETDCGPVNLLIFKSLRKKFNLESKEERREFLRLVCPLVSDWKVKYPDFGSIFRPQELDWLLSDSIDIRCYGPDSLHGLEFFNFVIRSGYKDKPDIDKDGKPVLRRSTPVHHAAKRRVTNWKYWLLDLFKMYNRFDVNYVDECGFTHFHAACQADRDDIVEQFLEHGQDPNCRPQESNQRTFNPPLHVALEYDNQVVAEMLLRSGADPNLANVMGSTPLHIICRKSRLIDMMKMFFEINDEKNQTVHVDARDGWGWTPLRLALTFQDAKGIELLLIRGASPNLAEEDESTPLHSICMKKDGDYLLKALFKSSSNKNRPVHVNAQDNDGNTPLHLALERERKEVVELLLKNNAEPNLANREGLTPLHVICNRNDDDDDLAKLFFKTIDAKHLSVHVDARDMSGRTPLQLAVSNLLPHVVEVLLDHGADISNFSFPNESYFGKRFEPTNDSLNFKLKLASGALAIVERLEIRGYELTWSETMTIMKFFSKHKLIDNSGHDDFWHSNENFLIKAKKILMIPSLSLYELIRSLPE